MYRYLAWCNKIDSVPVDLPFEMSLSSANQVGVVTLADGERVLRKTIRPTVQYIPRLKALAETAYSLLDCHLGPDSRVTPYVYPVAQNILWRQFAPGLSGDIWRATLYRVTGSLEAADLNIANRVLSSQSAQRIALLDFLTVYQGRSARNWIFTEDNEFFATDNGIFWPYEGRQVDKRAVETGNVDHLRPPMEAIVSHHPFQFGIGIFSSLLAGHEMSQRLAIGLRNVNWDRYRRDLSLVTGSLGYPANIVNDWRIDHMKLRAEYILRRNRLPTPSETEGPAWRMYLEERTGTSYWRPEWEIENSETI